jgi:FkbM family methyltransferase
MISARIAVVTAAGVAFALLAVVSLSGSDAPPSPGAGEDGSGSGQAPAQGQCDDDDNCGGGGGGGGGGGDDSGKDDDAEPSGRARLPAAVDGQPLHVCTNASFALGQSFFSLAHITTVDVSAERRIVATLSGAFELMCRRAGAARPIVVDVGVNDADDVPYWFQTFGRPSAGAAQVASRRRGASAAAPSAAHPACANATFFLFEPQARYARQIRAAVARHGAGLEVVFLQAAIGEEGRADKVLMVGDGEIATTNMHNKRSMRKLMKKADKMLSRKHKKTWALKRSWVDQVALPPTLARRTAGGGARPVALLKLDCEGADATILHAARHLFAARRVEVLIFEVNKMVIHFRKNYRGAVKMLKSSGYRVFMVGTDRLHQRMVLLEIDARLIRLWHTEVEVAVALSPAVMERLRAGGEDFGGAGGWRMTRAEQAAYFARALDGAPFDGQQCAVSVHYVPYPAAMPLPPMPTEAPTPAPAGVRHAVK